MSDWQSLDVGNLLKGEGELESLQDVVDILITIGTVAIGVLEILRAISTSFPKPIEAAILILLNTIQTILDNLRESGAYGLFLVPTTLEELQLYQGGYPRFRQLFLHSLYDTEDPNRPQIGAQGTAGALFLLVNQGSVNAFLQQIQALLDLFKYPVPQVFFPAPINIRIVPADDDGAPAESLVSLFAANNDLTTLRMSWEEPKFTQSLFYDIFAGNKFYIERSKFRDGELLTRQKTRQTQINPVQKKRAADGLAAIINEPVLDRNGKPTYVWEPLNSIEPFTDLQDPDLTSNFIAGQYTRIIRHTEKGIDNGYYYRIRSVPDDVVLQKNTSGSWVLSRNGVEWDKSFPSPAVFGYLPLLDTTFDMPTALLNTYRAAYLLRFDTTVRFSGETLVGSNLLKPPFPQYLLDLMGDSGSDYKFFAGPLFPDGLIPTYAESRRYASTVGAIASSTSLEGDPFGGAREMFAEGIGLDDSARIRLWVDKVALRKIDEILPTLVQNESLSEMFKAFYLNAETSIRDLLTDPVDAYIVDVVVRQEVALLINTVDRYEQLGVPPNWQALKVLRDIVPEGDLIFDRLFRLMKSLEGAFQGLDDALTSTIDGLRARLALLNDIVDFLDEILAFYASLDLLDTVSLLYVPPNVGGTQYIAQEFMSAGNAPQTTPDDFTAGVALVLGGAGPADITDSLAALKFIFDL